MALARVQPDNRYPDAERPPPQQGRPRPLPEAAAPAPAPGRAPVPARDPRQSPAPVRAAAFADEDVAVDPTAPTEIMHPTPVPGELIGPAQGPQSAPEPAEAPLAEVIDLHENDPAPPAGPSRQVRQGRPSRGSPPRSPSRRARRPATAPATTSSARRNPPVIRLGLIWTLVLIVAIVISPAVVALAVAPVAAIAAQSAWRRMETPVNQPWWLAGACAGVAPVAAIAGPVVAVLVVVAGGAALAQVTAREAQRAEQVRVALCSVAPAAGAASLVLATRQSVTIGMVLMMAVAVFDASNYVMGVGDTGGRLGALAGAFALAVLGVVLTGVLVVPFSGLSPWLLCGMVAVAAPVAVSAGHRLVGATRLPAWRRLDSLFIAGPLWVLLAALLLHP